MLSMHTGLFYGHGFGSSARTYTFSGARIERSVDECVAVLLLSERYERERERKRKGKLAKEKEKKKESKAIAFSPLPLLFLGLCFRK